LRLGILGGTFDPIHLGHLRLAEEVGEELDLERVYLVPAAAPPHKERKPVTSFVHRLAMARIGAKGSPLLDVHDLEGRRQGLSYSIETLEKFHELYGPHSQLFFIIGLDAFLEIETWKRYGELFDFTNFVVIERPGFQSRKLLSFLRSSGLSLKREGKKRSFLAPSGNRLIYKRVSLMDISSTEIRLRVGAGKSIRFLVPEEVRTYIVDKELYRSHGAS
jgi:nicotinate-nucleotide adenylyltransferase